MNDCQLTNTVPPRDHDDLCEAMGAQSGVYLNTCAHCLSCLFHVAHEHLDEKPRVFCANCLRECVEK